jgi:UDP-GlcNAc:undecaprenyl-phosphate/decaprenyl-phosphate GlcNAc-1-phosphate transferase
MNTEFSFFFLISIFSILIYFFIFYKRKKISSMLGTVDIPKSVRQIHKFPTPQTGSYSILIVFLIILFTNLSLNFFHNDYNLVIIASVCAFFLGLLDDIINLNPYAKILSISVIYLVISNFSEHLIITKFYSITYDTFYYLNKFSFIFTLLCILLLINSLNLADGINGLAVGLIFFWLLYITQIYESEFNIYIFLILTNLILVFIHNYTNKHFLGNSGSLMLSAFVGFLTIKMVNQNIANPSSINSSEQFFLLFLLPGIDMLRVFFERLKKNKNPFKADSIHLHHLLIKKYSLKISLIIYFLILNFSTLATIYFNAKIIYVIFFQIAIYSYAILYLKNMHKIIK